MASDNSKDSRWCERERSPEIPTTSTEIQCATFSGIRTRRGTQWLQPEEPLFLDAEKEKELTDKFSMASWISGIVTIRSLSASDDVCSPFITLLDTANITDVWMVCSELSDNNVYHIHFLLQTIKRSDSIRRTLLSLQNQLNIKLEVLKLAQTRYFFGMFCYLLKNPLMVFTPNIELACLAHTCIENGQTIKYNKNSQPDKPKDVVDIILSIIQDYDCKTIEDIYRQGSSKLLKYLHLSSLSNIMQNCLHFHQSTLDTWDPYSFINAPEADPTLIHNILKRQHINPTKFDTIFWKWLTKTNDKKNTIVIIGPSNTGKSYFIRGLLTLLKAGSLVNTSSPFFAEGICGSIIAYWEEPLLTQENAEMFKLITEGAPIQIPQKFKKPFNHPGCPLIITTNHDICRFCPSEKPTLDNRIIYFHFTSTMSSSPGCDSRCCLHSSRLQRRSTPCRLNWSQYSGDLHRRPQFDGLCWPSRSNCQTPRSTCGRWWCNEHQNRLCSSCSSSNFECSSSRGSSSSTSSSISRNYRSSQNPYPSGSTSHGIRRSTNTICLSGPLCRCGLCISSSPNSNWRNRYRHPEPHRSGGTRGNDNRTRKLSPESSSSNYSGNVHTTDQTQTKTSSSTTGQICTCILEPLPQDWQAYISYLALQNGT
uniref:Nonstructural protein n=1 Tax=Fringilla montifringilla Chaphamaparvovirus TaxID=2794489 RepID=A0A8A4XCA0_9VIRU|nr:MAG: nonstructural protein [Fringilla montifringilla Chaphamaparvovirus]